MAAGVYYKFKSEKYYDSIPIEGPFVSVGILKQKIFESNYVGKWGKDYDFVVTNAKSNHVYVDEAMLIPKHASVLIQRVPGPPRLPIVVVDDDAESMEEAKSAPALPSADEFDWDDFGDDLYGILQVCSSVDVVQPTVTAADEIEDSKTKAEIDGPDGGGRMVGGCGFGRGVRPPEGYVCHRCKIPGHLIQHCPTNGDPKYDIKRVQQPTGIPKSMLMATTDGSYVLPSGEVAVLAPNEAAFEKEIEGMPSRSRFVGDLPPELHCPLCKDVMKYAMLTSKCCCKTFCDRCIRNYIMSKSVCVCGDTRTMADDLIPNMTVRDTISGILEGGGGNSSSSGNAKSCITTLMAAAAASKEEEQLLPYLDNKTPKIHEKAEDRVTIPAASQAQQIVENVGHDVSEVTHESMSVNSSSAPLDEEEVQQQMLPSEDEAGRNPKRKKVGIPAADDDMQLRRTCQDTLAANNYMMPIIAGPGAYWNGMQPVMGMEGGYMAPYGSAPMPYMGYGLGHMNMPFGGYGVNGMNRIHHETREKEQDRDRYQRKRGYDYHGDHEDDHHQRPKRHRSKSSSCISFPEEVSKKLTKGVSSGTGSRKGLIGAAANIHGIRV